MIEEFYLEDYLSFEKIDLKFKKGLIVFTGASGAGKSILINAILSLFGKSDAKSKFSNIILTNLNIDKKEFNITYKDKINIQQLTQQKTRYLLNNQAISKKKLKEFTSLFSSFLHLKDTTDFDSYKIIELLDKISIIEDESYQNIIEDYKNKYQNYITLKEKLNKILKDEQEIDNLIEYTKFEIDKIEKLDPKPNEYEELKLIKTDISKKDKLENILEEAKPFLSNTHKISTALNMIDEDSTFFDDTINEVNNIFEKFTDKLLLIEDIDIEEVLDRIEKLSSLIKRFGSIEEALNYKEKKKKELEGYENISFEKEILLKNVKKSEKELTTIANKLSKIRKKNSIELKNKIELYLKYLYLENFSMEFIKKDIDNSGIDNVIFKLNNTELSSISSGEFNRLRLALLTARSFYEIDTNGILFLDEIDANLSGKESQSIAKVLNELSKYYQIFAISHQPQLSSTADYHYLVSKDNNISTVKLLNKSEKIDEIARMISGENITNEAIKFAKKLINNTDL